MSKLLTNERLKSAGVITFCLIVLFNPYIKTLDILPDFIAYFAAAKLLSDIAFKAPYFEEMRTALKRLGVLSIVRLICVVVIAFWRTQNSRIDDTVTLFIFALSVIELVFAVSAIKNFFLALEYLSERTTATALYTPFDKGRGKKMTPEELKWLSYIFAVVKCAANFIPEMCLLYRDPLEGGFNTRSLYPYFFLILFGAAIVVGAFWLSAALNYLKHIKSESVGVFEACEELVTEDRRIYIENKKVLKKKRHALICMMVGAFLNFELSFSEFREINLLPSVVFAVVMTVGFFILVRGTGKYMLQRISSGILIGASTLKTAVQMRFLLVHEYSDFLFSKTAKEEYRLVIAMAIVELLALIFFMITFAISMSDYTDKSLRSANTDIADRTETEYKRSFRVKAWVFSAIGIITGALKCAKVVINSTVNSEFVSTSDTTVGVIFYSDAPWISLLVGIAVIALGFYAIHYFGAIKDDEEMKYAQLSHI